MAITQAMCSSFKQQILLGEHDLDTDVIKIALYTSAARWMQPLPHTAHPTKWWALVTQQAAIRLQVLRFLCLEQRPMWTLPTPHGQLPQSLRVPP